jgi:hypothetical protein
LSLTEPRWTISQVWSNLMIPCHEIWLDAFLYCISYYI